MSKRIYSRGTEFTTAAGNPFIGFVKITDGIAKSDATGEVLLPTKSPRNMVNMKEGLYFDRTIDDTLVLPFDFESVQMAHNDLIANPLNVSIRRMYDNLDYLVSKSECLQNSTEIIGLFGRESTYYYKWTPPYYNNSVLTEYYQETNTYYETITIENSYYELEDVTVTYYDYHEGTETTIPGGIVIYQETGETYYPEEYYYVDAYYEGYYTESELAYYPDYYLNDPIYYPSSTVDELAYYANFFDDYYYVADPGIWNEYYYVEVPANLYMIYEPYYNEHEHGAFSTFLFSYYADIGEIVDIETIVNDWYGGDYFASNPDVDTEVLTYYAQMYYDGYYDPEPSYYYQAGKHEFLFDHYWAPGETEPTIESLSLGYYPALLVEQGDYYYTWYYDYYYQSNEIFVEGYYYDIGGIWVDGYYYDIEVSIPHYYLEYKYDVIVQLPDRTETTDGYYTVSTVTTQKTVFHYVPPTVEVNEITETRSYPHNITVTVYHPGYYTLVESE